MTEEKREIRRKKRVLEYAEKFGNINTTCRRFGIARSTLFKLCSEAPRTTRWSSSVTVSDDGVGVLGTGRPRMGVLGRRVECSLFVPGTSRRRRRATGLWTTDKRACVCYTIAPGLLSARSGMNA